MFSAKSYGSAKTTSSSIVCFAGSTKEELCYGEVEVIVKRADTTYFIVRKFILQPLEITMKPVVDRGMSTSARNVIDILRTLPNIYSKVESSTYVAISTDIVLCPAIIIVVNQHCYVKMER